MDPAPAPVTPDTTSPTGRPRSLPADVDLLVLDVDGVLTDGSINISDDGTETKRFHVRDGFGIALWHRLGFRTAVLTGRTSRAVEHRAHELGIKHIVQGSGDKSVSLDGLLARLGTPLERTAFMGDDWPDLAPMTRVGFAIAPADAEPPVLEIADLVTSRVGGHGAVREAIEQMLAAKGLLEEAMRSHGRHPAGSTRARAR